MCTGFKLRNRNGIYTALHGVLLAAAQPNRYQITIEPGEGFPYYGRAKVAEVDIEHDVAFLETGQTASGESGFDVAKNTVHGASLRIAGYPGSLQFNSYSVEKRQPFKQSLLESLPGPDRDSYRFYGSPAVNSQVFNLLGALIPGDSGAPLLDGNGRVMGIVNGAMKQDLQWFGWAIELSQIVLQPVAHKSDNLRTLAEKPSPTHYGVSLPSGKAGEDSPDALLSGIDTVISAARSGFLDVTADEDEDNPGLFKSAFAFRGPDYRYLRSCRIARGKDLCWYFLLPSQQSANDLVSRLRSCVIKAKPELIELPEFADTHGARAAFVQSTSDVNPLRIRVNSEYPLGNGPFFRVTCDFALSPTATEWSDDPRWNVTGDISSILSFAGGTYRDYSEACEIQLPIIFSGMNDRFSKFGIDWRGETLGLLNHELPIPGTSSLASRDERNGTYLVVIIVANCRDYELAHQLFVKWSDMISASIPLGSAIGSNTRNKALDEVSRNEWTVYGKRVLLRLLNTGGDTRTVELRAFAGKD